MSAQVLVVGSANVDLTTTVERLPAAGETVIGGALGRGVGGKGVNQAIAACRAGARVELRAAIGADEPGNWLLERVRGEGVCVDRVQRPASPTGTALVVVDGSGENQIVVCPGANAVASPRFASRALGGRQPSSPSARSRSRLCWRRFAAGDGPAR